MLVEFLGKIKSKRFWQGILFDISFIIVITFFSWIVTAIMSKVLNRATLFIAFAAYILVLIVTYSFFKSKVLNISLDKKTGFGKIFLINMVFIFITGFALLLIYLMVNYFVRLDFQKYYFTILLIIISAIAYISINLLQALSKLGRELYDAVALLRRSLGSFFLAAIFEIIGLGLIYLIYLGIYNLTGGKLSINPIFQILTLLALIFYNGLNRTLFLHYAKEKFN